MWATANIDAGGIDEDVDGTLWGPLAGLRYELNANNDFYVEYQYHLWEGDVGDFLNDGHALLVGIIHQFK
jgi:predicted porin